MNKQDSILVEGTLHANVCIKLR